MKEIAVFSKAAVITGATSGIGLATARALAVQGVNIIGVGRSQSRCTEAAELVRAENPEVRVYYLTADLASQRQVRDLGRSIRELIQRESGGRLDVLINNAAAVSDWYVATEDGYELQFAVNHLAPFLLTHELLPTLKSSARIITVSSGSHYHTRMHWNDLMYRKHYFCLSAYKQSKLANVLFTQELNSKFAASSDIRAYAVDPGLVNTQIGSKQTGGLIRWFWNIRSRSGIMPEEAAKTIVYLTITPDILQPEAIYWKECRPVEPSQYSKRVEAAARLWEISERLCGLVSLPEDNITARGLESSELQEVVP